MVTLRGADPGKTRQPRPALLAGALRLGRSGLLGVYEWKRGGHENRAGYWSSTRGRGSVGHVRVSSGARRAAHSLGRGSSSGGFRVGRGRSRRNRASHLGPDVRGGRRDQRRTDVRLGTVRSFHTAKPLFTEVRGRGVLGSPLCVTICYKYH